MAQTGWQAILLTIPLAILVAPLLAGAAMSFVAGKARPGLSALICEATALWALAGAAALTFVTWPNAAVPQPLALPTRLDAVSLVMLLLVSFVGWIVLRFSRTYLDGEPRQGAFTGWLCLTLISVILLVTAAHLVQLVLSWIATSLCLHRLLRFYPDRIGARRAARKKFIIARLSDLALIAGALLLHGAYGSQDLSAILAAARAGSGGGMAVAAAALLAGAAILKSAQFPSHGWLTEVMETPTPVSALLHAGIVNGGGFLLIRFADVMLLAPAVLALLVVIGGFTAIFGSLVMLTQPAVKTSLAWSTVAQMGFMIFECGLGLFPLALLHIVAHSLYKAHAFLASGGAVERVASIPRPGPVAVPSATAVGKAFLIALGIYLAMSSLFATSHRSVQALALGAILIFGVAYLIAQGLAGAAPRALAWRILVAACLVSAAYFALQLAATELTGTLLPSPPPCGPLEWALILLALASFGSVAVCQAMFPLWAHHPAAAGLRVHLSNGLYANAIFNRMAGGWTRSVQS